ncbi:MAG: hypothetical protein AAGF92_24520 [Myxococcota bacterium]
MSTIVYGITSVAVVAALTTAAEIEASEADFSRQAEATAYEVPAVEAVPNPPRTTSKAPRPTLERRATRRHVRARRPSTRHVQQQETAIPPRYLGGCDGPAASQALRSSRETVRVRVRLVVGADGVPTEAEMEQSHRLIPDSSVIACALDQRFDPAHLPDGTAIAHPFRRQFTFVAAPTDAQ